MTDSLSTNEYNALLVIGSRLTKCMILNPCAFGIDQPFGIWEVAVLLLSHTICSFGVSILTVHNQDIRFTVDL